MSFTNIILPGAQTVKVASATCGELLVFSGIGVAMLVFVLSAKLMYRLEEDKLSKKTLRKCSQVIDFCRQMGVWCASYLLANVLLLITTVLCEQKSTFYTALYNYAFGVIVLTSVVMLYLYFKYNVRSHLEDLMWSLKNLDEK